MRRSAYASLVVAAALLVTATAIHAAGAPEQCQAGKNRAAGKYAACRESAEAKLAVSGDTTKYGEAITNCAGKFARAWQKLEDKAVAAGSACPSVGDATGIDGKVTATTDGIAAVVGGMRFEDNGDSTVTDHLTGLQWEQKDTEVGSPTNFADPHDVDNTYTWNTAVGTTPNGTAFTDFLDKLNGGLGANTCLAGQCDWRLPTKEELAGIVDLTASGCGGGDPCIDPIFGPTVSGFHWTATTYAEDPYAAWFVVFSSGNANLEDKGDSNYVRAVRGGS